jgi:glucose-6-phosphate 1-dehydrogenase
MSSTLIQSEHGHSAGSVELKDDTVIVVLGASGDLAKKKTFPALFGLVCIPLP